MRRVELTAAFSECGLSYEVLQARDVKHEYEPIDGDWIEGDDRDIQFTPEIRKKLQGDSEARKALVYEAPDDASSIDPTENTIDPNSQQSPLLRWKKEVFYFRRMIIVWDPIWNFTFRALMCRCIIGELSEGSQAPPMNFSTDQVCPRHAPRWWNMGHLASHMRQRDYSKDPYFDQFGGYDMFRYYAVQTGGPFSSFHLDHDKFLPGHQLEHIGQQLKMSETEDTRRAALEYEKELYKSSLKWVQKRQKGGFDPELLDWTKEWQQLVEKLRPDINEPDREKLRWKNIKVKTENSVTKVGGWEIMLEV